MVRSLERWHLTAQITVGVCGRKHCLTKRMFASRPMMTFSQWNSTPRVSNHSGINLPNRASAKPHPTLSQIFRWNSDFGLEIEVVSGNSVGFGCRPYLWQRSKSSGVWQCSIASGNSMSSTFPPHQRLRKARTAAPVFCCRGRALSGTR